jgi:pimeloyl-ACP methyl ester carboxylesterase
MFRKYVVALTALGITLFAPLQADAADPETVILLHGYGRTSWSMLPLKKRLEEAGFAVHNVGYPSMRRTPAQLTEILDLELAACCTTTPRIHFVTHSLGGILTRAYLAEHRPLNMGRVVMLAPPNRGSELADLANGLSLLHPLLGPTVIQLGTGTDSLPNRLPPPWYELGVIAGVDDFNPIGSHFVPPPSDGTVSVASTQLDGMHDFVTVRKSHTLIMWSGNVADYVIRFLKTGRFQEPELPDIPPISSNQ